MKNILRTGLLAIAALLAFSAAGNAQISRQYRVHIPFDFKVGDKLLKAGDYQLSPLDGLTSERAVILQNRSTGKTKVIGHAAINSTESNKEGRLTFAKLSDQWLLSDVETPGFKLQLKGSAREEGAVAAAGKPAETTSISLVR